MTELLDQLNEQQREAVLHTEGPLLILAGAGSGKTKVLTHRIAYIIEQGLAAPFEIMAITFTNKAAEEMKTRVARLADFSDAVWVMTFHATCVRILRRYIDRLGYRPDFTIYDTDDQKTLLRNIIKDFNWDPKTYRERELISVISHAKNEGITAEEFQKDAHGYGEEKQAEIFLEYEKQLFKNNAVDFDDLLILTVRLFKENKDVLENYRKRFRYIMVDEYQDTNGIQFELVYLLSKGSGNLCVVGDDDQSIYRFRGADIRNILEFEDKFPGAKVIKLEQNYRSTNAILRAANSVIQNNRGRKNKKLWSENGDGEEVVFRRYETGNDEAEEIIRQILREVKSGQHQYKDYAILYRTNAQSRLIEEQCVNRGVPYRLVGGVNFYQRAEIKDIIAYLKTCSSGSDDLSVERILNVPKRGIGETTVKRLHAYAAKNGCSLLTAMERAEEIPELRTASAKCLDFTKMIHKLRDQMPEKTGNEEKSIAEFIEEILLETNYYSVLDDLDKEKADQKKENIGEFLSKATDFETNLPEEELPTVSKFLEDVALIADIDSVADSDDKILLMTIHGAKGLEFPTVFLTGMEDGVFPSYLSLSSGDPMDIEEERRLAYVGITRAMKNLYLSAAQTRIQFGQWNSNPVSRFIKELPEGIYDENDEGQEMAARTPDFLRQGAIKHYSYGSQMNHTTNRAREDETKKDRAFKPNKELFGIAGKVEKPAKLSYGVGDRVSHIKFGEGTVLSVSEGERDFEVDVEFDDFGTRHMYAGFAKLKKV